MPETRDTIVNLLLGHNVSKAHYESLGRFIAAFASAETACHILVRSLSGLPDNKARIIFNSMRFSDLSDRIRGIMRADSVETEKALDIDACLTQLNHISAKRHNLVHRSTTFFDGKLLVSNSDTAKTMTSIETDVFDVPELNAMTTDCERIWLRLVWHSGGIYNSKIDAEFISTMNALPWQYKHAPPKPPNQQPRKASRSRKRQPNASEQ